MKRLLLLFASLLFTLTLSAQTIDSHIKVDQFGYRPNSTKVAVISKAINGFNAPDSYTPGTSFQVRKTSGATVLTAAPVAWNSGNTHDQSGDKVWWFDFSSVRDTGTYYLVDVTNNKRSYEFRIADDVYYDVLVQACRMFFYQRCFFAKSTPYADNRWTDGMSHRQDTACRLVTDTTNASTKKNLSGGWFDAGDYNKYVNFTYDPVHQLLDAYTENPSVFTDNFNIPESGNGIPDLLDELKWELDWLMKMQLANGSVLSKVSTLGFNGASPASADNYPRYYGPATASSTRSMASCFAHAALVYRSIGVQEMSVYADTLIARAEKAWNWVVSNPATSSYNNSGFSSANPEVDAYGQEATRIGAAAYLYAATLKATYKTYFEANYTNVHAYQWTYWYPFEATYQDALLFYTSLADISPTVKANILNSCKSSVNTNNADLLSAWNNKTDAYRAYLKTDDYTWGSNKSKTSVGSLYFSTAIYKVDNTKDSIYKTAAEEYVHFMHGLNPIAKTMLTNMYGHGADNATNEMYHGWLGDGTIYDNALTSPSGPPHGYISGGFNKNYAPDGAYSGPAISPPQNQPPLKSYKDWNTSWPENSWQLTEPAIYTQASYIKLLSKFVSVPLPPPPCLNPTNTNLLSVSDTSAKINWTGVSGVQGYEFKYRRADISGWTATITADTFSLMTGLTPNSTYFWRIRSICGTGDTALFSDSLSFTTDSAFVPCTAPDSLWTTELDSTSMHLHWHHASEADSYNVYWRITPGGSWNSFNVGADQLILYSLVPDTTYEWYVESICDQDTSVRSDTAHFQTPANTVCDGVIGKLEITNLTDSSADINWTGAPEFVSYVLSYESVSTPKTLVSVATPPYHLVMVPGESYYVAVRGICANGDTSITDRSENIHPVTSVGEQLSNGFRLHPNPNNGAFTISADQEIERIQLLDVEGRIILETWPNTQSTEIKTLINAGFYIVKVTVGKMTQVRSLVIAAD